MDEQFKQLCVWEGVTLEGDTEENFIKFCKDEFDVRVKFCEEAITNGSIERNEEGGRHDLLFYVHNDDMKKFITKRLVYGIRWWEDVVSYNNGTYLYSQDILQKYAVNW